MKEGFASPPRRLKSDAGLDRLKLESEGKTLGEPVVRENHTKQPKWLAFFDDASDLRLPKAVQREQLGGSHRAGEGAALRRHRAETRAS